MATENIKITKAKVGLVLNQPFFATLALRRKYVEDPSIKTASTDGKVIKYNPKFIDTLTHDEVVGLIAHECMHIVSLHHCRREGREPVKWNHAADYAINPILLNSGFKLPKGGLYNHAYSEMSAEEIYKLLPDEGEDDGEGEGENEDQQQQTPPTAGSGKGQGKGQGKGNQPGDQPDPNFGQVEDAKAQTQSEMQQQEAEAKQELAQAVNVAKMAGKLPAGLTRMIDEILEPRVHWQEVLARFLSEVAKSDYSFSRPNQRYIGSGFVLPSLYNIEMGQVVLMVDTSGSIDREQLNRFAGEMQDICAMYQSPIKVLYVDTEVAGEQDLDPDCAVKLEPKGGGGTDFRPGFDWLKEEGITPKAVVYFTDMYCDDFPEEPEFPVLWASTGRRNVDVPFGEVINID